MIADKADVVVVGAGHGGAALAAALRRAGFGGTIVVIGDEPALPYHRPPLSKKFADDQLEQPLRPAQFYNANAIDMRTGVAVARIDRSSAEVELSDGSRVAYGNLVLATGSTPRRLSIAGADAHGVMTLRTLADARGLAAAVAPGRRLAIVGGGYIGLEVAAVARVRDTAVTILEREARVLARVASPELSERLSRHHTDHGTEIRTSVDVTALHAHDGIVRAVVLGDGSEIACDSVLVGVGAVPNDALASAAGLSCAGGIVVDEDGRTDDPRILAIGDVAVRPVPGAAGPMRLESIPNATEQAMRAASVIVGSEAPAHEVPWFWSDQFDLKLKIAGLTHYDAQRIVRPGSHSDAFSVYHLRTDGTVAAVETVNANADFMAGKRLIAQRIGVNATRLADPAHPLREILQGVPISA